jgi:hypothetical protein
MAKSRTTSSVIIAARKLIARREAWIKQDFARDKAGRSVGPRDRRAVSFCAEGALLRAAEGDDILFAEAFKCLAVIADADLVPFNDAKGRQHRHVLAIFDRTIDLAKRDERPLSSTK